MARKKKPQMLHEELVVAHGHVSYYDLESPLSSVVKMLQEMEAEAIALLKSRGHWSDECELYLSKAYERYSDDPFLQLMVKRPETPEEQTDREGKETVARKEQEERDRKEFNRMVDKYGW